MNTKQKAELTLNRIAQGSSVDSIINELGVDKQTWFRISARAYALNIAAAKKKREEDVKKTNVLTTSNEEIDDLVALNHELADYALMLPALSTKTDIERARALLKSMPSSEEDLISLVEEMTLHPRIRALQNVGRVREFKVFKGFSQLIESATISYYRGNYASAYLTLVPVVEGVILRWVGYNGAGGKPEFATIKKFFDHSHVRAPSPGNPLFHEVFCKACSKIINEHLYRPSQSGSAYSEFNRHQASHLLRDVNFATRENGIRLFLLLDTMAELYWYETCCEDPRWSLTESDIAKEWSLYGQLVFQQSNPETAENQLLVRKI